MLENNFRFKGDFEVTKSTMKLSDLIVQLQKIADELPFDPKVGKILEDSIYPDEASGVSWARDWNTVVIEFEKG